MVLVTVGTQKQSFDRLFNLIRNSKELKKEELVVQRGYTKCNNSKRIKAFDFIPLDQMEDYISKADLVISHGGVGTIFSAIKKGKKVIAVPRLAKYGEHINDHQIEICEALEKEGYILYYKDEIDDFDELIKKAKMSNFEKYDSNDNYIQILRKEI